MVGSTYLSKLAFSPDQAEKKKKTQNPQGQGEQERRQQQHNFGSWTTDGHVKTDLTDWKKP